MDRPLSKNQKRKATLKLLIRTLLIAIVPIVLIFSLRNVFSPVIKYDLIQTAIAEQGDISVTIPGAGVIIPNYEEVIGAPFRTKILIINNQPGDKITMGDTLMILDNEIAVNELNRLRNEMELMIIREERQETELIRIIEDFIISKEIRELKIKGLQSNYDNERKLNDIGGAPKEVVVKAEADLKISRLELKQAVIKHKNNVSSRKSSLREIETEIRIQKTLMKDADLIVSQAYVKAPFDGDLSLINDNPGVMVNEGQEIARIADYSKYRLSGTVSNSWTGRVQTGQRVIIRDKKNTLAGIIENIAPSVADGMLEFVIRIESGNIENLRPNQQLEIRVVLSYKDDVLRIPNGYYYTDRGFKEMFIIRDGKAYRTKVLLGDANFDYVEILEGLEDGDEVIIDEISKRYERDELKIKY